MAASRRSGPLRLPRAQEARPGAGSTVPSREAPDRGRRNRVALIQSFGGLDFSAIAEAPDRSSGPISFLVAHYAHETAEEALHDIECPVDFLICRLRRLRTLIRPQPWSTLRQLVAKFRVLFPQPLDLGL